MAENSFGLMSKTEKMIFNMNGTPDNKRKKLLNSGSLQSSIAKLNKQSNPGHDAKKKVDAMQQAPPIQETIIKTPDKKTRQNPHENCASAPPKLDSRNNQTVAKVKQEGIKLHKNQDSNNQFRKMKTPSPSRKKGGKTNSNAGIDTREEQKVSNNAIQEQVEESHSQIQRYAKALVDLKNSRSSGEKNLSEFQDQEQMVINHVTNITKLIDKKVTFQTPTSYHISDYNSPSQVLLGKQLSFSSPINNHNQSPLTNLLPQIISSNYASPTVSEKYIPPDLRKEVKTQSKQLAKLQGIKDGELSSDLLNCLKKFLKTSEDVVEAFSQSCFVGSGHNSSDFPMTNMKELEVLLGQMRQKNFASGEEVANPSMCYNKLRKIAVLTQILHHQNPNPAYLKEAGNLDQLHGHLFDLNILLQSPVSEKPSRSLKIEKLQDQIMGAEYQRLYHRILEENATYKEAKQFHQLLRDFLDAFRLKYLTKQYAALAIRLAQTHDTAKSMLELLHQEIKGKRDACQFLVKNTQALSKLICYVHLMTCLLCFEIPHRNDHNPEFQQKKTQCLQNLYTCLMMVQAAQLKLQGGMLFKANYTVPLPMSYYQYPENDQLYLETPSQSEQFSTQQMITGKKLHFNYIPADNLEIPIQNQEELPVNENQPLPENQNIDVENSSHLPSIQRNNGAQLKGKKAAHNVSFNNEKIDSPIINPNQSAEDVEMAEPQKQQQDEEMPLENEEANYFNGDQINNSHEKVHLPISSLMHAQSSSGQNETGIDISTKEQDSSSRVIEPEKSTSIHNFYQLHSQFDVTSPRTGKEVQKQLLQFEPYVQSDNSILDTTEGVLKQLRTFLTNQGASSPNKLLSFISQDLQAQIAQSQYLEELRKDEIPEQLRNAAGSLEYNVWQFLNNQVVEQLDFLRRDLTTVFTNLFSYTDSKYPWDHTATQELTDQLQAILQRFGRNRQGLTQISKLESDLTYLLYLVYDAVSCRDPRKMAMLGMKGVLQLEEKRFKQIENMGFLILQYVMKLRGEESPYKKALEQFPDPFKGHYMRLYTKDDLSEFNSENQLAKNLLKIVGNTYSSAKGAMQSFCDNYNSNSIQKLINRSKRFLDSMMELITDNASDNDKLRQEKTVLRELIGSTIENEYTSLDQLSDRAINLANYEWNSATAYQLSAMHSGLEILYVHCPAPDCKEAMRTYHLLYWRQLQWQYSNQLKVYSDYNLDRNQLRFKINEDNSAAFWSHEQPDQVAVHQNSESKLQLQKNKKRDVKQKSKLLQKEKQQNRQVEESKHFGELGEDPEFIINSEQESELPKGDNGNLVGDEDELFQDNDQSDDSDARPPKPKPKRQRRPQIENCLEHTVRLQPTNYPEYAKKWEPTIVGYVQHTPPSIERKLYSKESIKRVLHRIWSWKCDKMLKLPKGVLKDDQYLSTKYRDDVTETLLALFLSEYLKLVDNQDQKAAAQSKGDVHGIGLPVEIYCGMMDLLLFDMRECGTPEQAWKNREKYYLKLSGDKKAFVHFWHYKATQELTSWKKLFETHMGELEGTGPKVYERNTDPKCAMRKAWYKNLETTRTRVWKEMDGSDSQPRTPEFIEQQKVMGQLQKDLNHQKRKDKLSSPDHVVKLFNKMSAEAQQKALDKINQSKRQKLE